MDQRAAGKSLAQSPRHACEWRHQMFLSLRMQAATGNKGNPVGRGLERNHRWSGQHLLSSAAWSSAWLFCLWPLHASSISNYCTAGSTGKPCCGQSPLSLRPPRCTHVDPAQLLTSTAGHSRRGAENTLFGPGPRPSPGPGSVPHFPKTWCRDSAERSITMVDSL